MKPKYRTTSCGRCCPTWPCASIVSDLAGKRHGPWGGRAAGARNVTHCTATGCDPIFPYSPCQPRAANAYLPNVETAAARGGAAASGLFVFRPPRSWLPCAGIGGAGGHLPLLPPEGPGIPSRLAGVGFLHRSRFGFSAYRVLPGSGPEMSNCARYKIGRTDLDRDHTHRGFAHVVVVGFPGRPYGR